ncbi:MAG TPA: hypothetical protein PKJ45_08400 [Rubrivivax sp.]|nr:hypothetical protein [Rubrivivax sp.]
MATPIVPRAPRRPRITLTNEALDRLVLLGFIIFIVLALVGVFDEPAALAQAAVGCLIWIDANEQQRAGDLGFLVRATHALNGWARRTLQDEPVRTNMGGRPLLEGWGGTTDDVSIYALGLAEVVKVRGARALVRRIENPAELRAGLEIMGWPELAGRGDD